MFTTIISLAVPGLFALGKRLTYREATAIYLGAVYMYVLFTGIGMVPHVVAPAIVSSLMLLVYYIDVLEEFKSRSQIFYTSMLLAVLAVVNYFS